LNRKHMAAGPQAAQLHFGTVPLLPGTRGAQTENNLWKMVGTMMCSRRTCGAVQWARSARAPSSRPPAASPASAQPLPLQLALVGSAAVGGLRRDVRRVHAATAAVPHAGLTSSAASVARVQCPAPGLGRRQARAQAKAVTATVARPNRPKSLNLD